MKKSPKIVIRLRKDGSRTLPGPDKHMTDTSSDMNGTLRPGNGNTPKYMCTLRAPSFKDEMTRILGDRDPPYRGLFGDNSDAANTSNTAPNAEDRALIEQYGGSLKGTSEHISICPSSQAIHITKSSASIHYGQEYAIDAWYRSAYPTEYTARGYLAICSYCLDYKSSDLTAARHATKCRRKYPPGREIYRDGELALWEVDGAHESLYCQNLCLFAKAYLSSKQLYREVQGFFFYVLTELDSHGAPRFVGYFSKQKAYTLFRPDAPVQSLSCIVTIPTTQRSGYGQFLISFSYLMMRLQEAVGSPETPLSDLGEKAFRTYWKRTVCRAVYKHTNENTPITVNRLSTELGIHVNHIVLALEDLGWLKYEENKYKLCIDRSEMMRNISAWSSSQTLTVKPENMLWTPLYE